MMNNEYNDLDFIRDKFENSGVNAPDSMGEEFVNSRIAGLAQPVPVENGKEKKKTTRGERAIIGAAGGLAAASIAIVTACAVGVSGFIGTLFPVIHTDNVVSSDTAALSSFKSRNDVIRALGKVRRSTNSSGFSIKNFAYEDVLEYGADEAFSFSSGDFNSSSGSVTGSAGGSAGATHNSTYIQHTGVDEADTVKTDGRYIYNLNFDGDIEIFSAEGKNSRRITSIDGENNGNAESCDFYICSDRLVEIQREYIRLGGDDEPERRYEANDGDFDYEYFYGVYSDYIAVTTAKVYDISDISDIKNVGSFTQSGSYTSSRMIGATLYLISDDSVDTDRLPFAYLDNEGATPDEAEKDKATKDELAPTDIYTVDNPSNTSFLVVSSFDIGSKSYDNKSMAILGTADTVYCNQDNLYVTANQLEPVTFESGVYSVSNYFAVSEDTQIIKISLTDGIRFTATAKVKGRINNQYSLDEYDGNLRVATTSQTDDLEDINNFFVFDKNLNELGRVTGFAENESIKAVRYIGSTAYVITYEQTDPLFVIDASNPSNPQIKGEVKISGFSTMLVPVDNNTLLGIGYHTQDEDDGIDMEIQEGLKIVTFDVTDMSNPKVLDEKIFEDYYSEVQYNPKALLVNFERGDYTIPVNYYSYEEYSYDDEDDSVYDSVYGDYYGKTTAYSGVLNFRVENGKIVIGKEYVSEKFGRDDDNINVDRCLYVGNDIYLIGYDGYSTNSRTVIDSVEY